MRRETRARRRQGAARHAVLAAGLFAFGCASPTLAPPREPAEFELAGRFTVTYRGEATSGRMAWRHAAHAEELQIASPLGQTVARLSREGADFVLETKDRREFRAPDAEALSEQVLGFRLPLAGLSDWVRGRPAPGPWRAERDDAGRLAWLEQAGWRIEYLEYAAERPVRLRLLYPGMELRLAIAQWK
jgi:outer membrane lipoprotein LolB